MAAESATTAPKASTTQAKTRQSVSSQVNARIDPELKRRGDEGIAAAGLTPTQAVRALWSLAANCINKPERLRATLFPEVAKAERQERDAERQRKVELAREGADLLRNTYHELDLDWPSATSELSYEELRELAYREQFPEAFERTGA